MYDLIRGIMARECCILLTDEDIDDLAGYNKVNVFKEDFDWRILADRIAKKQFGTDWNMMLHQYEWMNI